MIHHLRFKRPGGNFDIDKYLNVILPPPWLQYIPRPLSHFLGYRKEAPRKQPDVIIWLWTWIGAFGGVAVIEAVFQRNPYFSDRGVPMIVGSFGATAVLLYGAIEAPFAQPRAVFFGHTLSAVTGVIITKLFRTNETRFIELRWLAGAIACATASVVMTITKTIHPPSGATAMIAATQADITDLGWYYIPVVMLAAALALGVGLLTNNIQRRYPLFWMTAVKLPHHRAPKIAIDGPQKAITEQVPQITEPDLDETHKLDFSVLRLIVTSSEVIIPDSVDLGEEHRQVLGEIQTLIGEAERSQKGEAGNMV